MTILQNRKYLILILVIIGALIAKSLPIESSFPTHSVL